MSAKSLLLLALCSFAWGDEAGDRAAVRQVVVRFNDPHSRAALVAADASLERLDRFAGQELSPLLFEAKDVRFVTADVAFVDAVASQYGSLTMKRTFAAQFVMRREGGGWRIAVMRVAP